MSSKPDVLGGLIAPLPVAEFFDSYYGLRPLYAPGPAGRFAAADAEEMARRLEYELETRVTASRAAGDCDAIVLQVRGTSRWRINDTQTVVADGGCLYLPRGAGAAAGPVEGAFQFAIQKATGLDLLDWAFAALRRDARFRVEIPRFAGPARSAEWESAVSKAIAGVLGSPGLAERFARSQNESVAPDRLGGVEWSPKLSRDHEIVIAAARPWRLRWAGEGLVAVISGGAPLVFDAAAAALLDWVRQNAPAPLASVYEAFDGEFREDEIDAFFEVMSERGLIALRRPEPRT